MSGIFFEKKILATINSEQELEEFLYKFWLERSSENPIIIYAGDTGWFYVGISKDYGFLNYHDISDNPPYYTSVGNKEMKPEERLESFYLLGHHSEIPYRNCIPFDLLINVLKEYFRTGKLSNLILWEKD